MGRKKQPENEVEVELIDSDITQSVEQLEQDMAILESGYNDFKKDNTVKTMQIVDTINMMELDTVSTLILDAKAKIESFSKGDVSTFSGRAKNTLIGLPLIGGFAKKAIENTQRSIDSKSKINEVFKSLFDNFTTKQNRIIELMSMLEQMDNRISNQSEYLEGVIEKTNFIIENTNSISERMRAKRLNEMVSTTLLKNNDKQLNKIRPGLMLAAKTLDNMNQLLPTLEGDMLDELGINGALNSFKDVNTMLKETMDLTSTITSLSAKNTEDLMLEVLEIADSSNGIKYLEDSQKRRQNFQKKFETAIETSIKKQEDNYKKVRNMVENYEKNDSLVALVDSYKHKEVKQLGTGK